ncbi:MAG TPA: acyltransferase, partial [Polyangiales bacterium]|nr:acyltransferase [Polyangiales bacterium]
FLFHSGNAGVISTAELGFGADFFWTSLRYGVEMFFMISGYVILASLLRHASIAEFLSERVIRIYAPWVPALVAVSVVCAVFQAKTFAHVSTSEGIGLFLVNLSLLPPLVTAPLIHRGSWSLTYEWVFYLAAAIAVALLRWPRLSSPMQRWSIVPWLMLSAAFVCFFPRATFFLTGVLVFVQRDWFERRRHWLRFPLLSMVVFLVAWRYTEVDEAELTITYLDFLRDGRWIAAAVAFVASLHMFASVVHRESRQLTFLDGRFFQFFGSISYSFYLWHALVMSLVKRIVTPFLVPHIGLALGFAVFVIASMLMSLAVSWVSWRVFEVHLARAMHRMRGNTKDTQSSAALRSARHVAAVSVQDVTGVEVRRTRA